MYKYLIRPLLFLIDPERVHHIVVFMVKLISRIPGLYTCFRNYHTNHSKSHSINVAGLQFKGRVGLAAGFDKNADFYKEFSMFGFSFIEIGTVTPVPQTGNPKPRLFRLQRDKALINRMGFNNKGVEHAVGQLKRRNNNPIIGGNIGKNTATQNEDAADDYAVCFEKLYNVVDYFTVNVSCPNIAGLDKLQDMDSLRIILNRLGKIRTLKKQYKPVFVKISPDLSFKQIDDVLVLIREAGFDGIIAANTTTSRKDMVTGTDRITAIGQGGLSGKPLTNRTLEIVSYICKQTEHTMPVIGVGGIMNTEDALNLIKAGACLIQLYSGFIYEGPLLMRRINRAMQEYDNQDMDKMSQKV
jgi:dihydroorotate dehydrogenase